MNKLREINSRTEKDDKLRMVKQLVMITIGNAMLALSMNLIITPFNLYCSGAMGVAQLVDALIEDVLHIPAIPGIAWLGLIYWGINIPVLLWGAKSLGKKFLFRTVFSITVLSAEIAVIPVLSQSIIQNEVMSCIAAGVFGGIGVGLVLTAGSGCGAGDVMGMVLSSRKPGFSVGMMNMIINVCIYTICAFAYGIENAVYSIFFAAILSWAMDKYHMQNHYMELTVYSKEPVLGHKLSLVLDRGVTSWYGEGGYTETQTNILKAIVTKHECDEAIRHIYELDPHAFISVTEINKVHGLFDKRFSK
ncbi:MAG: YitT family protein [Clostridiales bacterium]|nr:YitT family protein [Candidatus Crickella caballi]